MLTCEGQDVCFDDTACIKEGRVNSELRLIPVDEIGLKKGEEKSSDKDGISLKTVFPLMKQNGSLNDKEDGCHYVLVCDTLLSA